ncbi:hypothetical protein Tco_0041053 [Tanacetum coccineum]
MVYQNFLREFWSTAVAYDPFPSTDETKQRPLKEFLIKFSVLNGQRPLTLDFNTFCSSIGLDYNNGKYVAHPTPEAVKKELGKLPSIQLLAYSLITGTEVDIREIIYSDLVTKLLNKSRLKYVSYPRYTSCALQVLLGSDYTYDENFKFLPGILSNSNFTKDPSKVTDIELTAHMIAVPEILGALYKKSKRPESKKPPTETKKNIQLASTGLPSTLDEGTRKSKPFPESTATPPKVSGGNIQPLDRDITSTNSNEGTAKTTPHPEGSLRDKDSAGNIPPADMEPIHPTVVDLSRTGAKDPSDKLVEASMSSLDKSSNTISDLYKGLNIITKLLKEIKNAVKDDSVINKKITKATESFTKFSTNITELQSSVNTIQAYALKQDEELSAWAKSKTVNGPGQAVAACLNF